MSKIQRGGKVIFHLYSCFCGMYYSKLFLHMYSMSSVPKLLFPSLKLLFQLAPTVENTCYIKMWLPQYMQS